MDIKYNTDTKIEDNARLYQLQKANFDQEVNTAVSIFLAKYASERSTYLIIFVVSSNILLVFILLIFY